MSQVLKADHFEEPPVENYAYDDKAGLLESQIEEGHGPIQNPPTAQNQGYIHQHPMYANHFKP